MAAASSARCTITNVTTLLQSHRDALSLVQAAGTGLEAPSLKVSYAANRLCQDNNKPTQASWKAMRRVLSYLLATNDFKIAGKFMSGNNNLKSYSDSNIADDNSATTRSQTGWGWGIF